jgi:hypothetical protein
MKMRESWIHFLPVASSLVLSGVTAVTYGLKTDLGIIVWPLPSPIRDFTISISIKKEFMVK